MCVLILTASLSLVTLVSAAHSVEEKSETEGDQKTSYPGDPTVPLAFAPNLLKQRQKRAYLQKGTSGHHRLMPDGFRR